MVITSHIATVYNDLMHVQILSDKKASKKESRKITRKNQPPSVKKGQHACISSSNVSTPDRCSSYYKEYVGKLESNFKESLTVANYKERFHHLLCWEEREHVKQLAER